MIKLFTIGHSNHSIESFLSLLQKHQITAVADVRSSPYSKYLPHFSQKNIQQYLQETNISYIFLGKELGARTNNLSCYVNGKALYELIAKTDEFQKGLEIVYQSLENYNIALMCSEQDPITCHRAILVSRHLKNQGLDINHILKNGELENHSDLEQRLLEINNLVEKPQSFLQLSLFDTKSFSQNVTESTNDSEYTILEKAYKIQGDKIAYVNKK
ncbi:DUF488 family protein [Dapis sp. BLCC M172]|uniref:DUF488 domain-containing protein n=1 Tax=Dapis sp. BLCC M172 TaxID=2975281 RepID=UPI003CF0A74B